MVLVLILVDALRYDFVSRQCTPFISSLGTVRPLRTILGYSDAIRASIYSGTYPDNHGYWIKCCYRPSNSPFKALKIMKHLDYLPFFLVKRGMKFVLGKTLCKVLDFAYDYNSIDIFNMPLSVIELFDMTTKGGIMDSNILKVPTLFDLLRKHDLTFRYFDTAHSALHSIYKLDSIKNEDVIFVDIHYLDHAAHRFGIRSNMYMEYLHFVDQIVGAVVKKLVRKFSHKLDIMVFSDHGIVETEKYIDLEPFMKGDAFGRDFVFFLDSTIMHLWYLNPTRKDEVRNMMKRIRAGSFLSEEEKKQLRINFDHRLYGDDIYLLDPPYSIFPNFISLVKPKAMHAYHPEFDHQKGFIILRSPKIKYDLENANTSVIDIFPTVTDLLHLKAPHTCEGRSLVNHKG